MWGDSQFYVGLCYQLLTQNNLRQSHSSSWGLLDVGAVWGHTASFRAVSPWFSSTLLSRDNTRWRAVLITCVLFRWKSERPTQTLSWAACSPTQNIQSPCTPCLEKRPATLLRGKRQPVSGQSIHMKYYHKSPDTCLRFEPRIPVLVKTFREAIGALGKCILYLGRELYSFDLSKVWILALNFSILPVSPPMPLSESKCAGYQIRLEREELQEVQES